MPTFSGDPIASPAPTVPIDFTGARANALANLATQQNLANEAQFRQNIGPGLSGDTDALHAALGANPKAATEAMRTQAEVQENLQKQKITSLTQQSNFLGSVLNMDPANRATAYETGVKHLKSMGLSGELPDQYPGDATAIGISQGIVPVLEGLKLRATSTSDTNPMGNAGGGSTPATAAPGGAGVAPGLAQTESGGDPSQMNQQGFVGKYQVGAERAQSVGAYTPAQGENLKANEWKGTFHIPGHPEVTNLQQFRASPAAQDEMMSMEVAGSKAAIANTPGAERYDKDALLAVSHLGGVDGMRKFVATNGAYNPEDANHTRLSDYYKKFAGSGMWDHTDVTGHRIAPTPQIGAGASGSAQQAQPQGGQPATSPVVTAPNRLLNTAAATAGAATAQPTQAAPAQAAPTQAPVNRLTGQVAGPAPTGTGPASSATPAVDQQQQLQGGALNTNMGPYQLPVVPQGRFELPNGDLAPAGARPILYDDGKFLPGPGNTIYASDPTTRARVAVLPPGVRPAITNVERNDGIFQLDSSGRQVGYIKTPFNGRPTVQQTADGGTKVLGSGTDVLSQEGPSTFDVQKEQAKTDMAQVANNNAKIVDLNKAVASGLELRDAFRNFKSGAATPILLKIAQWGNALKPGLGDAIIHGDAAAMEVGNKLSVANAGAAERSVYGPNSGVAGMGLFLKNNPNIANQNLTNEQVVNMQLVGNQSLMNYLQQKNAFIQQHVSDFTANPKANPYVSASAAFDTQWNQSHMPQVQLAAADLMNQKPWEEWTRLLPHDQQGNVDPQAVENVMNLVEQIDPSTSFDAGEKDGKRQMAIVGTRRRAQAQ